VRCGSERAGERACGRRADERRAASDDTKHDGRKYAPLTRVTRQYRRSSIHLTPMPQVLSRMDETTYRPSSMLVPASEVLCENRTALTWDSSRLHDASSNISD
jgi:hypothetical protein